MAEIILWTLLALALGAGGLFFLATRAFWPGPKW